MGPGTAIEFSIKLIEALYSKKQSEEIAKLLILSSTSSFYND